MSKDPRAAAMIILADTREPNLHPWAKYLPDGWMLERGTLETGDFALAILPEAGVVERKTPSDMAGCIGNGRERFERELRRGRYAGRMIVVVEGTLPYVAVAARGIHQNAVVGTLAAWTRRYCPFVFCGSERLAADFAFRFLAGQQRGTEGLANALEFQAGNHSRCSQSKKAGTPATGDCREDGCSPF